jgi:hypothetical protein
MRKRLRIGIGATCSAVMLASIAIWAQGPKPASTTAPSAGHYQIIQTDGTGVFMLDTNSGRVWRYTRLTDSDGKIREGTENPCNGLVMCFLEVDRQSLTPLGWKSDVVRSKQP